MGFTGLDGVSSIHQGTPSIFLPKPMEVPQRRQSSCSNCNFHWLWHVACQSQARHSSCSWTNVQVLMTQHGELLGSWRMSTVPCARPAKRNQCVKLSVRNAPNAECSGSAKVFSPCQHIPYWRVSLFRGSLSAIST